VDLDRVADELYGLPPEDFIAIRTEREKQAKAAGDRDLAAAIRALTKPNTVGWLANQLVRAHRDQIEPLLELGAGLREATANLSGDELRTLGRQRHQLIYALVQLARAIAKDAGRKVSDDTARGLESTLNAALADEAAAEQLLAGQLTDSLERGGFTPADDVIEAPVRRASPSPAGAKVASLQEHRAAQLEQARRDVDRAEADVEEARAAQAAAHDAAEQAERDAEQAQARVDEARAALDETISAQVRADERRREAHTAAERAERLLQQADRRLADATHRRDRLS